LSSLPVDASEPLAGDSDPSADELELDADAWSDPPSLPVPSGPGSLGAEGTGELAFAEDGWLVVDDGFEEGPFEHPDAASNATIGRIAHL